MKKKIYLFTVLYFVIHLMFIGNVKADNAVAQTDNEVVQQEDAKVFSSKEDVASNDDDTGDEERRDYVVQNAFTRSYQRRWDIDGYVLAGVGMSFARPLDMNGINYSSLLRKFQYGFIIGGGVMLNDIYGIGLSFINMRGVDKVGKNDSRFRFIQAAHYMINLDVSLVVPIRLFKGKLQFYAIGGITGMFTDISHRLKDGVAMETPSIKFSFGANVGGGIEVFMSKNLSARLEGRYFFVPTSAPVSDFFMMQIMLMLRI